MQLTRHDVRVPGEVGRFPLSSSWASETEIPCRRECASTKSRITIA
jgi:hypothetical protein